MFAVTKYIHCCACVRSCRFGFFNGYCVVHLFILQLVASVDESLYQKSLQTTMLEAKEEWIVDDDEGLFFYPKVRLQIFRCLD
jgi:hypothetical protein